MHSTHTETDITIEGVITGAVIDPSGKISDMDAEQFHDLLERIAAYLHSDAESGITNQVIWGQAQTGAVSITFTVQGETEVPALIRRVFQRAIPDVESRLTIDGPIPERSTPAISAEHYSLVPA